MRIEKILDYAERYLNSELSMLLESFLKTKNKQSKVLLKAKIEELEMELEEVRQEKRNHLFTEAK